MRKRCILLLLVCTLLMGCVCPAQASIGNEDRYRSAQNELIRYFNGENSKTLDALCADFAALGRYEESPSFLYYTSILRDLEAEDFSRIELYLMLIRADADFCAMMEDGALPSVTELEAYALGRKAEAEHDGQLALEYYQKCNAMLDSQERMVVLFWAAPTPSPSPTPRRVTPTPSPTPRRATPTPSPTLAPMTLSLSYGNSAVTLSWSHVSGATQYYIYRDSGTGFEVICMTTNRKYTDPEMGKNRSNAYYIEFADAYGRILGSSSVKSIYCAAEKPSLGSYVTFGAYEQDNRTGNGKEKIEWLVLDYDSSESYAMLLSRYCLDAHYFNKESYGSWGNSDIRSWLNGNFYNAAFNSSEKNALRLSSVQTLTENGRLETTQDRVYLLSSDEAMRYFPGGQDVEVVARRAVPTAYAVANMAYQSTKTFVDGKGTTCWWLRSFYGSRYAHGVRESGKIFGYSLKTYNTNKWYGVRPVIWVDVSALE